MVSLLEAGIEQITIVDRLWEEDTDFVIPGGAASFVPLA
jgi:hypothetical protein